MKILIKNCNLISMDENRSKLEYNMDILIHNKIIKRIDKNIDEEVDKIIDATNKFVLPGLINTHAHIPMSIFRETVEGYNLQDWLEKKIWPMESKLTDSDIYYASYLSFIEMIKTGTTCVNNMYFSPENVIKAMKETGVRLQTTRTLMNNTGEEDGEKFFNEFVNLVDKYKDYDDKLTLNLGIHSLYTTDSEYLDKCLKYAKDNNLLVHMHFCENMQEVGDIYTKYEMMPVQIFKNKFSNMNTILAHCVKLSKNDIDNIKDMNISVSHCPISNLKLGCGIANINYMLEKNINVSLGTDGQGSGCNLDLFEIMKYTSLLQKGNTEDPTVMPAYDVLKMATINGAKTLGLDNKIGMIKENMFADIIIVDMNDIVIKPINNVFSEFVYNVKGHNVDTTIINGNILMENRKLVNDGEEEICLHCDNIIKRIENEM